ncbi:MAG: hypothetical protein J3K34DRAFT_526014 [Monoraphidium minutum]|nr:MAG: hypothetical protein J3K34DRAFT_526014 [Monoraphidium minutum]
MPKQATPGGVKGGAGHGPEWGAWSHVLTGRELLRGGQVGVVLAQFSAMATLPAPGAESEFTIAWRGARGAWRYPDYYDLVPGVDLLKRSELHGLLQARFVDHPKLPEQIRQVALPLQENGWNPLPQARQREVQARANAAVPARSAGGSGGSRGAAVPAAATPLSAMSKRARGGAAEESDESEEEAAPSAKRGRGRPRKHPLPEASGGAAPASLAPAPSTGKRGPGRPRKSAAVEDSPPASPAPSTGKRGRGRPRKHPLPEASGGAAPASPAPALSTGERGRGRPRKSEAAAQAAPASPAPSTGKRGPGRPRKLSAAAAFAAPASASAGKRNAGRPARYSEAEFASDAEDEAEDAGATGPSAGKARGGKKPLGSYVGLTGREYPANRAFTRGDKLVVDYTAGGYDDGAGEEFEVEAILDEARIGKRTLYLIKWKGYELDVGDKKSRNGGWEPRHNIADAALVAAWKAGAKYPGFDAVEQEDANAAMAKVKWAPTLA